MLLVHKAGGSCWGGRPDSPEGQGFKDLEDAKEFARELSLSLRSQIIYVSDNGQDIPDYIFYHGLDLYGKFSDGFHTLLGNHYLPTN